jgi:plastocyanin
VGVALVTGATVVGVAAGSGPASAQYTDGTGPRTINIEQKGKRLFFDYPKTISKGQRLTIVNRTNPKKVGPHTFSLVLKPNLPKSKKERKSCFDGSICFLIAMAHKFDPKTEKVHKKVVEVGRKGWDTSFGKKGDSWFTGEKKKGTRTSRKVSAAAGTTLYFMCAVHPGMQGKIKVVE